MRTMFDHMAVTVPEGTHGTVAVERFEVGSPDRDLANYQLASGGRSCRPGTYTRIVRNGTLWMSDTTAERHDHYGPADAIDRLGGRLLIGGLGLGMIVHYALTSPGRTPRPPLTHIDVVEVDPDVLALVGPHYEAMAAAAGVGLTLHEADLYHMAWPKGTRWDVVWLDIWPDLCTDNLALMAPLRRSYGQRAEWSDCWGREYLLYRRRQERAAGWW